MRAAVADTAAALINGAGLKEVGVRTIATPDLVSVGAVMVAVDVDPAVAHVFPQVIDSIATTPGAAPLLAMVTDPSSRSLDGLVRANGIRHQLNGVLATVFDEVDLLLMPTSPVPAFGATGPIPEAVNGQYVGPQVPAVFTSIFNLTGHPVVSVPAGIVDGTPVGMQIVSRRHEDALGLAAAAAVEQLRPWPKLAPFAHH